MEKFTFSDHSIYPESELTIYLHKNFHEEIANLVVRKFVSKKGWNPLIMFIGQKKLKEFKSWSGFGEGLEILDDNPFPAVVMVKPTTDLMYQKT